jgi:hypothetical protein
MFAQRSSRGKKILGANIRRIVVEKVRVETLDMPRLLNLSMVQLERMLARQREQVAALQRDRALLQRQFDTIDAKIRSLGGNGSISRGVGRTPRARNAKTLVESITEVLGKAKKPMSVGDVLNGVLASGYRSNAANFRQMVNLTLLKERNHFVKTGFAMYAIKK